MDTVLVVVFITMLIGKPPTGLTFKLAIQAQTCNFCPGVTDKVLYQSLKSGCELDVCVNLEKNFLNGAIMADNRFAPLC